MQASLQLLVVLFVNFAAGQLSSNMEIEDDCTVLGDVMSADEFMGQESDGNSSSNLMRFRRFLIGRPCSTYCTTTNYVNCCTNYRVCCQYVTNCPAPSTLTCAQRCTAGTVCPNGQLCCPRNRRSACCSASVAGSTGTPVAGSTGTPVTGVVTPSTARTTVAGGSTTSTTRPT